MKKYPLAASSWDDSELEAIQRVVDSGQFTMGKYVEEFEKEFANYVGSRYAVMVNSGSSANLIAVAALFYRNQGTQLKRGDEVLVPAVSWGTSYHPLHQYGLKLKFVDIDKDTLNYDLAQLENAITDKTKMILAVNLLGNPNDFASIEAMIGERDIILLEDNCESLGATYQGKQTGTFGLLGTYSSFFSHHICTMEGGLTVTDDEELYHIMLSLRAHGWTRNLPQKNLVTGEKSSNNFEESFKFVLPGYNLRPLEMSGAVGLEQLKKLPDFIATRRRNAKQFVKLFGENPYWLVQKEIGESSWFGFSFILKPDAPFSRLEFIEYLTRHQIDCRPIVTGDFTKNEVVKYFDYEISGEVTNAEIVDREGLFIGNHHFNLEDELVEMKELLNSFVRNVTFKAEKA